MLLVEPDDGQGQLELEKQLEGRLGGNTSNGSIKRRADNVRSDGQG